MSNNIQMNKSSTPSPEADACQTPASLLEVRNVSKRFGEAERQVHAVRDVSFTVKPGEVYGLIGLSGAGKSTLVRCLNLLERPDEGQILYGGIDLTRLKREELRRQRYSIGMIFQHFNLFAQKTVAENIAYPLKLQRYKKEDIHKRVCELLDYIDLSDKANAWPSELSGGQKQRVAIARALAPCPRLLLSDEGTSALDPETTQSILALIRRAVQDNGISAVMITHQMEVAKSICDRIGVMEDGCLIEENTVENLFLRPQKERTRRFIQTLYSEFSTPLQPVQKTDSEGRLFADSGDIDFAHVRPERPLYRLGVAGANVSRPVIAELLSRFHVEVNLMAGNINWLQKERVGYLCVELNGNASDIAAALNWLAEINVDVEVLR